jgi:FKBP-type peptidyl-prolyl cis-trans isomerase FkpA
MLIRSTSISVAFVLIIAVIFISCGEKSTTKGTTEHGYSYEFLNDVKGETPKAGEYAYFQMDIKAGDSLITTTRTSPRIVAFQLREEANEGILAFANDAFSLMSPGDSMKIVLKNSELPEKIPNFDDDETMTYTFSVSDVKSEEAYKADMEEEKTKLQAERDRVKARLPEVEAQIEEFLSNYNKGKVDGLMKTDSGLEYVILKEAKGNPYKAGEQVEVHYVGKLMDGKPFDDSFKRGAPFRLQLGQGSVIPGWEEGLLLLGDGAKAIIVIPPDLGYGAAGSPPVIPENATLLFYVETGDQN